MTSEYLVGLPPLSASAGKSVSCEPGQGVSVKISAPGEEVAVPDFLKANTAFAEHLHLVKLERMRVLARLEQTASLAANANEACTPVQATDVDGSHEYMETVLSFDFTH